MTKYSILSIVAVWGFVAQAMELEIPAQKSLAVKMIELAVLKNSDRFLERLDFSGSKIENLTEAVNNEHKKINNETIRQVESYPALYTITNLTLSNNLLADLPPELKLLSNIEYFDGSKNLFPAIPSVVAFWNNTLQSLIVPENQITSIEKIGDEPLSNFKKLQWLNIKENNIAELPCEELYELYQEQREQQTVFWVCVDRDYKLNDDLAKIRERIFYNPNAMQYQKDSSENDEDLND